MVKTVMIVMMLAVSMTCMFSIKYRTRGKLMLKNAIHKEVMAEERIVKILRAEAAYLSSPSRIRRAQINQGNKLIITPDSKIISIDLSRCKSEQCLK